MRRAFVTLVASILVLGALASTANAGDDKKKDSHFGPYAGSSTDSGTCGNDWANDTFKRHFTVTNDGGTWTVREDFKDGKFVTVAGASPGACQTSGEHGLLVDAGIRGNFKGWLSGDVTGGTFDPDATCADPCTGDSFIAAHFGATATWNVVPFRFEYHAEQDHLAFRQWQNASPDQGANQGDIASQ